MAKFASLRKPRKTPVCRSLGVAASNSPHRYCKLSFQVRSGWHASSHFHIENRNRISHSLAWDDTSIRSYQFFLWLGLERKGCLRCKSEWKRFSDFPVKRAIKSPQARVYIYKITSGRSGWPSRDPIEESGGLNLYGFANENPIQYYDAFGLQSLLTILECAQASPAYDFADCICAFAGDEDDCKKQMGGCLNAIGSKLMNKAIFHGPGPSG